ncbi:MAG: hypothetical protein PHN98_08860 [Smithellaceae bacterium]|nr:hypothetical protein [Smithellaceae bacterium]
MWVQPITFRGAARHACRVKVSALAEPIATNTATLSKVASLGVAEITRHMVAGAMSGRTAGYRALSYWTS